MHKNQSFSCIIDSRNYKKNVNSFTMTMKYNFKKIKQLGIRVTRKDENFTQKQKGWIKGKTYHRFGWVINYNRLSTL